MKVSSLKIPAVVALVLGAVTSANAAMSVPRANGGSSIVLIGCAYGWYRGPDGQCYVVGTQPRHRGWYQGQHNYEGYPSPFRAYPYYGGYRYYGRPYENDQGDDDQ